MKKTDDILEACRLLEELDVCPELERVPAAEAYGRVLAEKIMAGIDVPHFRRSAFDGYALRSADIKHASPENPVILRVTETIPAGSRGRYLITEGTAARIMTGAMVPKGADTVVKHEDTRFTEKEETCLSPMRPGNIVEEGKVVLGLSGNLGAVAVGLLRIGLPYLKKLCGRTDIGFDGAESVLEEPLKKAGKGARILRGRAKIRDGRLVFVEIDNQRNGSVSSMLDCDLLGEIPPGSSGMEAGEKIKVYFI